MTASGAIRSALEREVDKLIRRHNAAAAGAARDRKRYEKRSGELGAIPDGSMPPHWEVNPRFNPYYVRSRFMSFAHAIAKKVATAQYKPEPALTLPISKPGGGFREISISTVPDAAVAYWLGRRLIGRNSHRFSSYTYAYRADRNAHHAIEHLMGGIRGKARLFVLEYDFAKYFDSIRHDYLERILRSEFLVSARELTLLLAFLNNSRARSLADYTAKKFEAVSLGIPQGSNVSLFLANVACFELDREIERVGGTFARYADDTLVVCDSYEKADACAKLLQAHGDRSGTKINFAKSPGISLLTSDKNAEIRPKNSVDFLSHSLASDGVQVAQKAVVRMKKRVAKILYDNLLLQPKRKKFNAGRIGAGFVDWDLVTCLNELRRYVYGRLSEKSLSSALSGTGRVNKTLGAMSFYPNVDERGESQLRALDGWMLDCLERAHKKRGQLLAGIGIAVVTPARETLISGEWYDFPEVQVETKLPSFYRAWLYVQIAAERYGLEGFPSPSYDYL